MNAAQAIAITLLPWTLFFTAPRRQAALPFSCPTGCRDTTATLEPCGDLAAFEVWEHHQSPTWVAKHDSMQADPAVWARYWPDVRGEAGWHLITSKPAARSDTSKTIMITMPDSLFGRGYWWATAARDTAGNRSCLSNEVAR